MHKSFFIFLSIFSLLTSLSFSQPKIHIFYDISCEFNLNEKTLKGIETIKISNRSSSPLNEIYLNLNMNAFRNLSSSFFKEYILLNPIKELKIKDFGGMEIISVRYKGEEIKGNLNFIFPENNREDKTLASLKFPAPLPPGGTESFEIEFLTKIPQNFIGIGYTGNYFLFSGWYPKLSFVEERKGNLIWNFHNFHFPPLINSSIADYRVEINIPRNMKVGGTGSKIMEKKKGKKKAVKFYSENVRDFVWVASPSFLEYKDYFIPEKDFSIAEIRRLRRISAFENFERKIEISLLIRPERKIYMERYFKTLKEAIRYFWLNFSGYPYPNLTFIDFPSFKDDYGIIFPNLVISDHPFFCPEDSLYLEKAVLRGLGKEYWGNIIGVKEIEDLWLSNALSNYSQYLILKNHFKDPNLYKYFSFIPVPYIESLNLPLFGFYLTKLRGREDKSLIIEFLKKEHSEPILKKPWNFTSFESFIANTKFKPVLILLTLERYFGERKLLTFLKKFLEKYSLSEAETKDFLEMIESEMGGDARNIFEYYLFKDEPVDYRVKGVRNIKLKGDKDNLFLSTFIVEKKGDLTFPVEIEVIFDDGNKILEKWDGNGKWKRFTYRGNKIKRVSIDPYKKFLLDENMFNNTVFSDEKRKPFIKALILWNILIEQFFHNLSFFI